ncbi:SDR family oxidoreductase [Salinicola sp. JS01]|uniref:SDR family NAD(P)-dependent oxidoreductase n=1 Tax=Salinicola sp. JS01 TaxID=3050071 RepID=UPI00255BE9C7|nr:SDR family oxidoreductase [Salinicola sp. JS01]WIX33387.1 SDR family oxidoreductase [Salinicola sp. JS01]
MSESQLQGRIAVITGGGVGIGYAIARALAAAGARVVVTYRSHQPDAAALEALSASGGEPALARALDVTDEAAVAEFADWLRAEYGRVDILINNAGGLVQRSSIDEMPYTLWRQVQTLNVDSVFLVTHYLLPLFGAEGGRIITLSSLAGRNGGHPGATAYATAKAALFGFTRGLAKEVAARGITVNALAPGFIEATPFHATFTSEASKRDTVAGIPAGRAGVPEDVASAALWLASDGAAFVSGSIVDINGAQYFG